MEEIWKDIEGYEGLYQVSNLGRVKGLKRIVDHGAKNADRVIQERIIKPWNMKSKSKKYKGTSYKFVSLSKNGIVSKIAIHRLVGIAFIPNHENKPCINHIDGIPSNNIVTNLEWCTYSENNKHAFDNGLKAVVGRKPILRVTLDGSKTKKYKSMKSAVAENQLYLKTLSNAIQSEKPLKGYLWQYC